MNPRYLVPVLVAVALITAGCSSDDDISRDDSSEVAAEVTSSANPNAAPVDGAFFSIVEVGVGGAGYVTLQNYTGIDHSLGAYVLCQGDDCSDLPDVVVEAGALARIATGDGDGLDGVVATEAPIGDLKPSDGELALYRSDERSVDTLIAYYQWGSDQHETTDDAIEAGLWLPGSYGPTGADAVRLWLNQESGLWLWDSSGASG